MYIDFVKIVHSTQLEFTLSALKPIINVRQGFFSYIVIYIYLSLIFSKQSANGGFQSPLYSSVSVFPLETAIKHVAPTPLSNTCEINYIKYHNKRAMHLQIRMRLIESLPVTTGLLSLKSFHCCCHFDSACRTTPVASLGNRVSFKLI